MEIEDPKLHIIIHNDFLDYNGLEDVFSNCNALFWCLGISQSQVNKFEYEKITYDYTIKAAETVQKVNPTMVFVFLSGAGADNTEKSKAIFARIKGKTENKLKNLGLTNLYIVRPGGIKPIHKNPDAAFFNKLIIPIFPLIELIYPSMVIASDILSKAMIWIAKNRPPIQIFENNELKNLGSNKKTN